MITDAGNFYIPVGNSRYRIELRKSRLAGNLSAWAKTKLRRAKELRRAAGRVFSDRDGGRFERANSTAETRRSARR